MAYVLVVDDDDDIRESVCGILRGAGHTVLEATDGGEALASMRLRSPCLLLLDLMMPGVDGWEVVRQMQGAAELARIPICVMSARRTGIPASAGHTLNKPFSVAELLDAVGALAA